MDVSVHLTAHSEQKTSFLTYAIIYPRAVVIKFSHATVAVGAMLGSDGLADQARGAESVQLQCRGFCQFNNGLEESKRTV